MIERRPRSAASRPRSAAARKSGKTTRFGPRDGRSVSGPSATRRRYAAGHPAGRGGVEFRRLLEAERRRLLAELDALGQRAAAADDMPRTGGETAEDDALADAAIHTLERDRDSAVESSLRALLEEVEQALARYRQGTYGICVRCREPIHPQRLRAIPHATLCVACKADQERTRSPLSPMLLTEWRVFKPPKDWDEEENPGRR